MSASSRSSALSTLLCRKRVQAPVSYRVLTLSPQSLQPLICSHRFDGVSSRCREILPLGSTKSSTWTSRSRIISFHVPFAFPAPPCKVLWLLLIALLTRAPPNGDWQWLLPAFLDNYAPIKICGLTFEVLFVSFSRHQAQCYSQPVLHTDSTQSWSSCLITVD